MEGSIPSQTQQAKKFRQHYFVAKEVQITIALLVVLALVLGAFLQSVSSALNTYFGFTTPVLSVFLTIGYIIIIAILAIFFTNRLLGPFKRLEYEMKLIAHGDLNRRLSIRSRDDLRVRNFVAYVNEFIDNFQNMSKDYSKLHSNIGMQLNEIGKRLEKQPQNLEEIKESLRSLQKHIHESREKW